MNAGLRIRDFQPGDEIALAALFHAAVHQLGRQHYTAQQCAAWSPSPPAPALYLQRAQQNRFTWVAVDAQNEPAGYCDLEPNGHIDHLYCRPDMAETGVAGMLYGALERTALQHDLTHLFVDASENARRLFERRGFMTEQRNVFQRSGVWLHNYRMRKTLPQGSRE